MMTSGSTTFNAADGTTTQETVITYGRSYGKLMSASVAQDLTCEAIIRKGDYESLTILELDYLVDYFARKKSEVVKIQKYEEAAALREKEQKLVAEIEKRKANK